jgi:hypothetical protein
VIILGVFSKLVSSIKSQQARIKSKKFSCAEDLQIINTVVKPKKNRFLAASSVFMRKHGKKVLVVSKLILTNLEKLKKGEIIKKKGFVIRKNLTGKSYPGNNNVLTVSVSFNGKIFFIKMGGDCGEKHLRGYQLVKKFFKEKNNQMYGYNVRVVPYHLIYSQKTVYKSNSFLISDFFPSDRFTLVLDEKHKLSDSPLGNAINNIRKDLKSMVLHDIGPHNCFIDKSTNTLYFFDMYA